MAIPETASSSTVDVYHEYTEDNPGVLNNMFGSLFGVAVTRPETKRKLTSSWYRIVRQWYPGLHEHVYCCPPLHFNAVAFKPKPERPEDTPELYERYGMRLCLPTRYSTVKSDESQQRVMATLKDFAERKGMVSFIVSNMQFENYLNKSYEWTDPENFRDMPKPDIRLRNEEGEIDILVIDKTHGVIVLEVKANGDEEQIWNEFCQTEEKKVEEVLGKFRTRIGSQIEKGKLVVRKLLSDLEPKINIRGAFVLVNVKRSFLEKALETYDKQLLNELLHRLNVKDIKSLMAITFCYDDLPKKYTPREEVMTEKVFRNFDRVWTCLMETDGGGVSDPMSDDLYEHIVARFCGPLTTVKIYTEKTYPRVRLEVTPRPKKSKKHRPGFKTKLVPEEALTKADAARVMSRRFSELVLLQEQIEILQRDDKFVHLEGPPGTGKTLLLLLRVLTWLDEGHMVWILSLSPNSRSVSHVLMNQVKKMVTMNKKEEEADRVLSRLSMFMMPHPESATDADYYKRWLLKFRRKAVGDPYPSSFGAAGRERRVCLALDETGVAGRGLKEFFQAVAELHKQGAFWGPTFMRGLSVWSASVERVGRPGYAAEPGDTDDEKFGIIWRLTMPLRCPPSVQRTLMLVQPHLNQDNICCFSENMTLSHPARQKGTDDREIYAADGLPVNLIAHGSHKHPERDIWCCYECGDELADYLQNVLHIGEEECDCEDKPVIYDDITEKNCPDCHKLTKGTLPAAGLPLKYNDVMIVATQRAFQFSVPIGKFALAMKKRNLKVAVSTTREEGQAPISSEDVILIADITSVHGLERAIIVVIPEVKPPPPLPAGYRGVLYQEPAFLDSSNRKRLKTAVGRTVKGEEDEDEASKTLDIRLHKQREVERMLTGPSVKPIAEVDTVVSTLAQCAVEGEGESTRIRPTDMPMEDTSTDNSPGRSTTDTDQRELIRTLGVEIRERRDVAAADTSVILSRGEGERRLMESQGSDPSMSAVPFAYHDAFSKREISAALGSLSPQSRQDVFYIGSRSVCQLILVHLGKNRGDMEQRTSGEEPMQTE